MYNENEHGQSFEGRLIDAILLLRTKRCTQSSLFFYQTFFIFFSHYNSMAAVAGDGVRRMPFKIRQYYNRAKRDGVGAGALEDAVNAGVHPLGKSNLFWQSSQSVFIVLHYFVSLYEGASARKVSSLVLASGNHNLLAFAAKHSLFVSLCFFCR